METSNWSFQLGDVSIHAVRYANSYDSGGNLTGTVYPGIEVTTLAEVDGEFEATLNAGGELTIQDQAFFDAWGNLVESIDRNGNASFAYYDELGRTIATVDADGFLITSAFDSQGNLVQQTKYKDPISASANANPILWTTPK